MFTEENGDYVEVLTTADYMAHDPYVNIYGHSIGIYGTFTRYRGEYDVAQYGECILDRDGIGLQAECLTQAALYMS